MKHIIKSFHNEDGRKHHYTKTQNQHLCRIKQILWPGETFSPYHPDMDFTYMLTKGWTEFHYFSVAKPLTLEAWKDCVEQLIETSNEPTGQKWIDYNQWVVWQKFNRRWPIDEPTNTPEPPIEN